MRRFRAAISTVLLVTALTCGTALADDIIFTPEGGGKWIYCNNPEGIRNRDLMNHPDCEPTYIMNNEHLEPDLYDFLICHINSTDTEDGYGAGYDIELDVELTAEEDSEIVINKAFFETPQEVSYIYGDGTWDKQMHKVGCLNALASFLGVNLCELNGSWLYEAREYEPVTIEIKKGETVWLGEYTDGYSAIPYAKMSEFLGEIELTKGMICFNVAAFKSGEELGDRSGFDPDAAFGKYAYDRTQKGIADTLPKVNTYLEYTIDNTMQDGDLFPNKVFNQYRKEGFVTDAWCSHLNPQDDIWSKNISAESDLLTFNYTDDSKLEYYGSRVKKDRKNNVWIWDPYHSDTTHYEGIVTWFEKAEDYYPNYELSPNRSNQGYACSMGNYCVTESYNLKVKNKTAQDKYFEYAAQTVSNLCVFVEDEDGKHSGFLKGEQGGDDKTPMASVKIPAKGEREFTVNVVLPINYVGGIRNYFLVRDNSSIDKTYEDYVREERPEQGPLTYGVTADTVWDRLPEETRGVIDGNSRNYEIIKTDFGYMMRYMDWDGIPYYFYNSWSTVKNMYILDKNYKLVSHYTPDFITELALDYDGWYYREDAEGMHYRTKDGENWEKYNHRLPIPEIAFNGDEPSDWADKEIRRAYEIDAAPYDLKDKLEYTAPMTREIFCYVLSSMLELSDKMPQEIDEKISFSDTTSKTIRKFASAGIIAGYEDGSFRPKGEITRQEAAMLLYKTMMYASNDGIQPSPSPAPTPSPTPTPSPETEPEETAEPYEVQASLEPYGNEDETDSFKYADNDEIGDWARDAVYAMNSAGVMFGVGESKFAPKLTYTNEQSIATILRLYDFIEAAEK